MRRLLVFTLAAAALVPLAAPAATARARVWVPDTSPLVVRGSGFRAHERVVVQVTMGTRLVHVVRASAAGAFVTRWTAAATKAGCGEILVRATGSRGSVATAKRPGVECPNGPTDPLQ